MNGNPKDGGREGGCRCGAVAFRARAEPEVVVYCHCRDCRRSNGAPVSLWAGYQSGLVELTRGEPTVYESSPGVRRSFCGTCGSPISFEDERLPGETYLPGGVFDDPEAFEPGAHDWTSLRLRWFDVADCPATKRAASWGESPGGIGIAKGPEHGRHGG